MKLIQKISILMLLFFAVPAGKLFEIFHWNVNIIRTEHVLTERFTDCKGKTFVLSSFNENKSDEDVYSLSEQIFNNILNIKNTESEMICLDQTSLFQNIKTLLHNRFLFNIIYSDDYIS